MNKTPIYTLNANKARLARLKADGFKYKHLLVDESTDSKLALLQEKYECPSERVLIEHFKN